MLGSWRRCGECAGILTKSFSLPEGGIITDRTADNGLDSVTTSGRDNDDTWDASIPKTAINSFIALSGLSSTIADGQSTGRNVHNLVLDDLLCKITKH